MGIPDHLAYIPRNLYAGQEATVRTRHGTMDRNIKDVCCYPSYLTYMQSTPHEMPDLMNYKLESRLLGEISITSDTQKIPPLWQKTKKNYKGPLMKGKEETEKVGLKLNIQKMKIMASSPITSWEIDGETVETVSDFIFGGLQNPCRWSLQP